MSNLEKPSLNDFTVSVAESRMLNVAERVYLAGATATLNVCIAFVAAKTGISIGDAILMATANPSRFVGARGVLRVGAPTDLVRFNWEKGSSTLTITDVVVQGKNGLYAASCLTS